MTAITARELAAIYVLKVQREPAKVKKATSAKTAGLRWIKERNSKAHRFCALNFFYF